MDNQTLLGIALGLGCGLCVGFFLRGRVRSQALKAVAGSGDMAGGLVGESGEHKLVLVVRSDLKMGKGKAAAQCSHAAVMAYKSASRIDPAMLKEWEYSGQPKVVVKTDNEQELMTLAEKARSMGLIISLVRDAGRTQIAPHSRTVLGVGPGPVELVDDVTGHLKLF